ncbi:non-specific serine,threonine protein kinase, partial [Sarracenia purpurea var. burkii]
MALELIIQITTTFLWLTKSWVLGSSLPIAKEGCQDSCGNVSIPYPFGISSNSISNCYISQPYSIDCRTTADGGPKPFLTTLNLEVLIISIGNSNIYVNNPVISWNCTTNESIVVGGVDSVDLGNGPFVFSVTDNWFTSVGCNNLALMTDLSGATLGGCMSLCRPSYVYGGSNCYGINCCQTSIPANLHAFKADLTRSIEDRPTNSCTHAFMVDQNWFMNLDNTSAVAFMTHVPAVLEWSVDEVLTTVSDGIFKLCANVTNMKLVYAGLGSSSFYVNMDSSAGGSGYGYRCICQIGEGNPYLPGGCPGDQH